MLLNLVLLYFFMNDKTLVYLLLIIGISCVTISYVYTEFAYSFIMDKQDSIFTSLFCVKINGSYVLSTDTSYDFCAYSGMLSSFYGACELFDNTSLKYAACNDLFTELYIRQMDCVNLLYGNLTVTVNQSVVNNSCNALVLA